MRRKYTYPLLMMVAITLIYLTNDYLDQKEKEAQVSAGAEVKSTSLSFLLPEASPETLVHHQYYSLAYNEEAEQASWVAYTLDYSQLTSSKALSRPYFMVDDAVKTGAADWRNYKNSGYDRGHLCPAADRSFSTQAYNETFLTSNISPQLNAFNSGVWNRLEHQVREWASIYTKVTVITGGVFENNLGKIGEEEVVVPGAFYKLILRKNELGYSCLAFLIPHSESDAPLQQFVVAVDQVEQVTGIDFFPQLEDSIEQKIEAEKPLANWVF